MTTRRIVWLALLGAGCVDVGGDAGEVGTDSSAVAVTWTNVVGVTATGNDLTKPGGVNAWDAGAVSVETLVGDGYVEFTTAETTATKQAGLSSGDSGQGHADIDFAIRLRGNASVGIYEAGVLRGNFGAYAAGDRFRVAVEDGLVTYWRNGVLLYTSSVAPTFPLLLDTSFLNPGGTLHDAVLVATSLDWQNVVGVTIANGNDVTKTSTATGWSAGAFTVQFLSGDGFAEFTVAEANTAKAAGLSQSDDGQHYADIDFAIRLSAGGAVTVWEGGVLRGGFGRYVAGDRFRVEVAGGAVQYSKNGGRPFYVSAVAASFPLHVDTAFQTTGGSINDVVLRPAGEACPAWDGTGRICYGTFYIYNEFDVAEIADCVYITGNVNIFAPGMLEVSLPKLERVGGLLHVENSPDLDHLRLPELKQVGDLRLVLAPGVRSVDLSRLRTATGQAYSWSYRELSAPCLESAGSVYAYNRADLAADAAYVPRLREVTGTVQGGRIIAPALETAGELAASYLSAPVLVSVTEDVWGEVDAPALLTIGGDVAARPFSAPSLTDIGGTLHHFAGQDLPALERAGELLLWDAPATDLPALVEVDGRLGGGGCVGSNPAATEVALPDLRRVGSLALCWDGLTAVDLPALETITGPGNYEGVLVIRSTALPAVELPALVSVETGRVVVQIPLSLPALQTIGGPLDVHAPLSAPSLIAVAGGIYHTVSLSLPALEQVAGLLSSRAPLSTPALAEVGGTLRIQFLAAETSYSFPALATVGGLYLDSFNLTAFDVPSLTTISGDGGGSLAGDVRVVSTRIPFLALGLVATIPGDLIISNNDSMTSFDLSSLGALGPTLTITGNAVLPACYATNLRDQLLAGGWTGTWTISGNNGTGTCP
jgi:hypothetical protein